jgi:hypothetical protein
MTSLYDQYHSEKNIDHIYNLLDDLIQKNNGNISIKADIEFKNYYLKQLREIFIKSESDNLTDLNRELLKHHILYYKNKNNNIKSQNIVRNTPILNKPNIETNTDDNTDVKVQFDEYLKMRELPETTPRKTKDVKDELSFNDMMKDMNTQPLQNAEEKIKPNILPKILEEPVIEKPVIEKLIDKPKRNKDYVTLTSANRTDIMSNRYNYNIKCDKDIKQLERLIIPIENTLHFTSPILKFKIIESNIDINLYLRDTYKLNNYTYGVYIPENETILNKINDNMNIQICSIYDNVEIEKDINDIIECELSENKETLKPKNIVDFKKDDFISINSKHFTKIIDIVEDELVLENIPLLESDENIYIMNMNLQNTLVFY